MTLERGRQHPRNGVTAGAGNAADPSRQPHRQKGREHADGASQPGDLLGRVALVTGGSSGIGLAAARAFLHRGAKVAICGRDAARGQRAVAALSGQGDVTFARADVTDESQARALVDRVLDRYGRLDVAFNAATSVEGAGPGTLTDTTLQEFETLIRSTLTSAWLCLRYEIPAMLESGGGAIVNTSSVDAHLLSAGTGSYAAGKLGVEALTVTVAKEFATRGIRVNAVRPGAIRTPMLERNLAADSDEERQVKLESYTRLIAMRRLGQPEEVAETVTWLCSDTASYVTGQIITVDGAVGL